MNDHARRRAMDRDRKPTPLEQRLCDTVTCLQVALVCFGLTPETADRIILEELRKRLLPPSDTHSTNTNQKDTTDAEPF